MLHKLSFDTTNLTTVEDTHSVGAFVRSGAEGALITHHDLVRAAGATFVFVDADITVGSDSINEVAHGYKTGDRVQLTTTGVLPAGLALTTYYYVIRVDADNFKLALTPYNAEWGVAVDITAAAGGGDHTVTGFASEYKHLDVYAALADGTGNPISSTGGSINVNMTNTPTINADMDGVYSGGNLDPDNAGLIAHVRDATPDDTHQTFRSTGARPDADDLDETLIYALDVNSFGMVWDGTGWDRMIGNSTNGLTVNVSNTSLPTNDAALANTAITTNFNELGTANVAEDLITAGPLTDRKYLWVYNNDNQNLWIGATGVTSANGFPIPPGSYMAMRAGAAVDIEWVSAKINHKIRHMELS